MNRRLILKTLGMVLFIEALCMLVSMMVGLCFGESPKAFALSILVSVACAVPLSMIKTKSSSFFPRDGLVTVSVIWLVISVVGALPFYFSGEFPSFIDCVFESASGFSTTGASILSEIESLPKGILFWRSMTHFLGGMGVLVLVMAILPSIGERTHNLLSAESTGPKPDRLVSTIGDSAKILYLIYLVLTAVEAVLLRYVSELPWYDSVVSAFATAGTGGFSVLNTSIAGYNNLSAEIIITIFMLLFGVNFSVFFLLLTGHIKDALKNSELFFYIGVIIAAIAAISINTYSMYGSVGNTLRYTSFQVISIITTTGFVTSDFELWPTFSKFVLFMLMLIGACAGSTGGGMKCSRILILLKSLRREVHRMSHPRLVKVIKMDRKPVSESVVTNTLQFFVSYFFIVIIGSLAIGLEGHDFTTTLTSVVTCISNVGPGFGLVGATQNFAFFGGFSKLVLSFLMLAGRLEIFPMLILFSRSTWKDK